MVNLVLWRRVPEVMTHLPGLPGVVAHTARRLVPRHTEIPAAFMTTRAALSAFFVRPYGPC